MSFELEAVCLLCHSTKVKIKKIEEWVRVFFQFLIIGLDIGDLLHQSFKAVRKHSTPEWRK